MAKEKNIKIYKKNSFYHIYNRGNHKEKTFYKDDDYETFLNLMYKYLKKSNLLLIGYCLMPNHYHIVLKCGENLLQIPKFMHSLMTSYVMYFNRRYFKVGRLFQGPFRVKRLTGVRNLKTVLNYLKNNPVEAGLIDKNKKEKYKWINIKAVKKG